MTIKKAAALLLAVLTITSAPITVLAKNGTSSDTDESSSSEKTSEAKALEAAINDVKKKVTIPSDLDKFEYESETEYGITYYTFEWYKGEKPRSYGNYYYYNKDYYEGYEEYNGSKGIIVTYFNGTIASYDYFEGGRKDRKGFSKLTDAQLEKCAKDHLKRIYPDLKGEPVLERNKSSDDLTESDITYNISRFVSDIEFVDNEGKIVIDKDTGELREYKLKWWNNATFPDASKRLSVEAATEIYRQNTPLGTQYSLFKKRVDDENGEYHYEEFILPVYVGKSEVSKMDAITGEYTALYEDRDKFSYTDAYSWYDDGDVDNGAGLSEEDEEDDLSEAELAAIEAENKYLTYDKCLEIIKNDKFIVFNKELVNATNTIGSYTDIKGEERPLRKLYFKFTSQNEKKDDIYLDVRMDALTGEIISFNKKYEYGRQSPNANTRGANDERVLARANAAAKHFLGAKADEYKPGDKPYVYRDGRTVSHYGNVDYTRYVNDLPAYFDDIWVRVDSLDEVLGFSYTYHDMEFPEPDLVGEDTAYKKLFEHMKPELKYTGFTDMQLKPHTYLTYYFDDYFVINALTGDRIDYYNGSLYYTDKPQNEEKAITYSDIKGHKYEKEIQALVDYGVCASESDMLKPDERITVSEFANIFDKVCGTNILWDYSEWDYDKGEYIYDKNFYKALTRSELAKIYVMRYAQSYSDAASLTDTFKAPFDDIKETDEYCGWIAIAKAKGFVSGKNGKFYPDEGFTKAECYKLAYDFLAGNDNDRELYEIIRI